MNDMHAAELAPYETPAIVYESDLEVRAGTPLGLPDPLDPNGTGK